MCHYGCGGKSFGRCVMKTPICDFVNKYIKSGAIRLHMPGHKGESFLGFENFDITEICGADSLYQPNGIIKESMENASNLFGANTFYSAEGSSLSIRAMVYLFKRESGENCKILAGRNAHKSFISACALTDVDVEWLYPKGGNYLSGLIDLQELEIALANSKVKTAVYITTPDYLGNMADIGEISKICKKHNAVLLVDNAHGAYLKFLEHSLHPMDLGADMCCDSAHKTLPVLTGGAYLHISHGNDFYAKNAMDAMSIFGSTSPSYLILQSLDMANKYISGGYREKLFECCKRVKELSEKLCHIGINQGQEPLKITLMPKKYGYYGFELAEILEKDNIFAEFSDRDFLVMMFTPESMGDIDKIQAIFEKIPKKPPIIEEIPLVSKQKRAISFKKALYLDSESVIIEESIGRIFMGFNISCPPAVPLVVLGERIDENSVECMKYYGIKECRVLTEEK